MPETTVIRPRVLFLTAWYPHEKDSMFGLFIRKHALAVSRKCDVVVLYAFPGNTGKDKYRVIEQGSGNLREIYVYYREAGPGPMEKIIHFIRWIRAYSKAFTLMEKKWGLPQLVHANILTRIPVMALYLKITKKIPYIISEHWSRYLPHHRSFTGFWRRLLTRKAIQHASAMTVVSELLGDAMIEEKLTDQYFVLPNVIDTELFQINRQDKPSGLKTIVHISCFEEKSKNLTGIIQTIKLLSEMRSDFILKMVGTGDDWESTVQLSDKLELTDKFIQFSGLKEGKELATIVSNADLCILPSHYETFGIVVFESLACGVPVLVSDVADFKKLITNELGKVLSDTKPDTIAQNINIMLNNLQLYDPVKLRRFVTENFSEEMVCMKTLDVYKSAPGFE